MKKFASSVRHYMRTPVHTILESEQLTEAAVVLETREISALGVVDPRGALVGVISRTDLIHAGRMRAREDSRDKALSLPAVGLREFMTPTVEIIGPDRPLHEAARGMLKRDVHRLFVSDDRRPIGVITTTDLMRAVVDARLKEPIADIMHIAVISVEADRPVAYAVDRMAAVERSGLVVTEEGWPVGVFTQADALAARDAPATDRVEAWMDPRIICVPMATPIWRAAQQTVATRPRRLLTVDGRGVRGVVTSMDFARVVEAGA